MVIQGAGAPPTAKPSAPDVVVEGKSNLVCTSVRMTGSRVSRQRRCRSREQAEIEAQQSRDAIRDGAAIQSVGQALACGPTTPTPCN